MAYPESITLATSHIYHEVKLFPVESFSFQSFIICGKKPITLIAVPISDIIKIIISAFIYLFYLTTAFKVFFVSSRMSS